MPATGTEGQKTDLTVYLAAAQALKTGQDIYETRNVRGWPYLYPPLAALIFVPLADLPREQAAFNWFLVSLGCIAGSTAVLRTTLLRIDRQNANRACLVGLLPVLIPMLHTLQRGQINALPLLSVCLALWAIAQRRDVLSGICLAVATAIKVTPGLAVGYFLWKWIEHQAKAVHSRTWRPAMLAERTGALFGFVLGLGLGLVVIPGLYMGPRQAVAAVAAWRTRVAGGYMAGDESGQLFRGSTSIHEMSDRNQSWYRVIASSAWLYDHGALSSQNQIAPAWQGRIRWILVTLGMVLMILLAWASRDSTHDPGLSTLAGLAAFTWMAVSFGKIAWSHFYVMVYPLAVVAWLVARRHAGTADGWALRWMLRLLVLACVLHYSLTGSEPLKGPTRTRAQRAALKMQIDRPRDLGELLIPTGILALATTILVNRRRHAVDCANADIAAVCTPWNKVDVLAGNERIES